MSNNKAENAANQQKAENARINAENKRRNNDVIYQNAQTAEKQRKINYDSKRKTDLQQAGLDAQDEETKYRAKKIKDSGKVLTDWELQEKIRLLEARKGTGQVDAENMRITNDMLQDSNNLLDRGADYWDARRKVAYDDAYQKAEKGYADFERKVLVNENYQGQSRNTTDKSRTKGRDYEGRDQDGNLPRTTNRTRPTGNKTRITNPRTPGAPNPSQEWFLGNR